DGKSPQGPPQSAGGWIPALEESIQGEKTGYKAAEFKDRFWEDVKEGEELPRLFMPITLARCVYLVSATRDFAPPHFDIDFAKNRSKAKDAFVNTSFNMGMVTRFMTDWAGPKSTVRKLKVNMRQNVCVGDDMVITGKVIRKYVEEGDHRVDLDIMISTQDGPATPCDGTLSLPSRSADG
ncbi:hypothetical protein ACFL9T_12920, partial [Thermodesulfobacteriota bacterium]